ncbi:MAG: hypothetical protein RBS85_06515 [Methanofastidiosum sp.]|nr:hypothetical protein [Methanofastidiosum sp.]
MKYTMFFLLVIVLFVPLALAQEITFEEYPNNPVFDPDTRHIAFSNF